MHWSRAPSLISCLLQHPRPSPAFTTVRSFSKLNSRHPSTQHCTTYKTVHISLRCVCNSISAHPNIPRIPYLHIPSPRRPSFSNTQAAISQLQSHRSNWPNRQYWLCCCSYLFGFILKERTDAHTLYPPLFGRKYVVFYSLCVNCGPMWLLWKVPFFTLLLFWLYIFLSFLSEGEAHSVRCLWPVWTNRSHRILSVIKPPAGQIAIVSMYIVYNYFGILYN